jgi:hypothetical protein
VHFSANKQLMPFFYKSQNIFMPIPIRVYFDLNLSAVKEEIGCMFLRFFSWQIYCCILNLMVVMKKPFMGDAFE